MTDDDALAELREKLNGLAAIQGLMLSVIGKDQEMIGQLRDLEEQMRKHNAPTGTIEMIRSCRIMMEQG